MKKLTAKQLRLFNFIRFYFNKNKAYPTIAEMREEMGSSSDTSIVQFLNQLVIKGYIDKDKGKIRGIKLRSDYLPSVNIEDDTLNTKRIYQYKYTAIQQNIIRKLKDIDPKLSDIYEGYLFVVDNRDFNLDWRVHAASSLRGILEILSRRGALHGLEIDIKDSGLYKVKRAVNYSYKDHINANPIFAEKAFRELNNLNKKLVAFVHYGEGLEDRNFLELVAKYELLLDKYILVDYLDVYKRIDEIALVDFSNFNSSEIKTIFVELKNILNQPVLIKYFFERIDEKWFDVLAENEMLEVVVHTNSYFERMASVIPEKVIEWMADYESKYLLPYSSRLKEEKDEAKRQELEKNFLWKKLYIYSVFLKIVESMPADSIVVWSKYCIKSDFLGRVFDTIGQNNQSSFSLMCDVYLLFEALIKDKKYEEAITFFEYLCNAPCLISMDEYNLERIIKEISSVSDTMAYRTGKIMTNCLVERSEKEDINSIVSYKLNYAFYNTQDENRGYDGLETLVWELKKILDKHFDNLEVESIKNEIDLFFDQYEGRFADRVKIYFYAKYGLQKPKDKPSPLFTDMGHKSSYWVEEKSPKTSEDLSKMTMEDVVDGLVVWDPTKERKDFFSEYTPDALGDVLSKAVGGNIEEYSRKAMLFSNEELLPVYLCSYFRGIQSFIAYPGNNPEAVNWGGVFELMKHIIEAKKNNTLNNFNFSDQESNGQWNECFKSVLKLLRVAMDNQCIEIEHKKDVWEIISLVNAIEVEEGYIRSESKEGKDYFGDTHMNVINTVYGLALINVFAYILWVNKDTAIKKGDGLPYEAKVFILDRLKDRVNDIKKDKNTRIINLMTMFIYGQYFGNVYFYERDFAIEELMDEIFCISDSNKLKKEMGYSALYGYFLSTNLHKDIFSDMRKVYTNALGDVGKDVINNKMNTSSYSVIEYYVIMLFKVYINGIIEYNDQLFSEFFSRGGNKNNNRSFFARLVGNSFIQRKEGESINKEKLKDFWKKRTEDSYDPDELVEFVSWLKVGYFEDEWTLKTFLNTLEKIEKLKKSINLPYYIVYRVVDSFSELAKIHPLLVGKCFLLIVKNLEEEKLTGGYAFERQASDLFNDLKGQTMKEGALRVLKELQEELGKRGIIVNL